MNDTLEAIARQELDRLGYDLVAIKRGGSKSRPTVEMRIDRRDEGKVTVDDCAAASRAIEARLDAEHLIGDRYTLEVSSPGADRPLNTAADWRRFVGRRAKVLADAVGGREEVEIVALEGDKGSEVVIVRNDRGAELRVPLAAIREARLVVVW
ncbi:MAG: ribosome maturation factor RimP [Gemmatimonadaceae bacterium]